jgi:hypothetical protein
VNTDPVPCSDVAKMSTYSGRVAGAGGLYTGAEAVTGVGLPAAGITGTISAFVGAFSFITDMQALFHIGCSGS